MTKSPGTTPIEPVPFTPLEGAQRVKGRGWTIASIIVGFLLVLCGVILWFLFSSRALLIVTDPQGAAVDLSGGTAFPLGNSYLALPGEFQVTISAPGYYSQTKTIVVSEAAGQQLTVALDKKPGILKINTPIDGVQVELDGQPLGTAPGSFADIPAGVHTLSFSHPRYRTLSKEVSMRGMELTDTVSVELEPAWGNIPIESTPAGAAIFVNGRESGLTPDTVEVLESGEEVRLELSGYKPWSKTLAGAPGNTLAPLSVNLEPADATVKLATSPSGARVTVNGEYRGMTPLTLALEPDLSHRVALFQAGYKRLERTLTLRSGDTESLSLKLLPDLGQIRIAVKPEGARIYVDGKAVTPRNGLLALPSRPHKIEARLAGHAPVTKTVTPKPGIEQQVTLTLLTQAQAKRQALPAQTPAGNGLTLKLFPPQPATFTMGSSRREQGRRANETRRDVALKRLFYLSTEPVTNAQFKEFRPLHSSSHAGGKTLDTPTQPVVNISWADAALYCNWLSEKEGLSPFYVVAGNNITGINPQSTGYRLPTEAEWAWAARYKNGIMAKFLWGEEFPPPTGAANFADQSAAAVVGRILPNYADGFPVSAPASRFTPNEKGLYSMGHNIAEWTHDFYGTETSLGTKVVSDPLGPESGEYHVIRGASWRHGTITELRLSFRDYGKDKRPDVGFRLARYAVEE